MKPPSTSPQPASPPKPPRVEAVAPTHRWRRWIAFVGVLGFGALLTGLFTLAGLFAYYGRDLPDVHALRSRWNPPQTTRVLARDGSLLAELFLERRTVVPLEHLPENLVKALLAAEDAEFYTHRGLDWPGMVRALWVNIRRGTVAQGASTITQQVVKNVLLSPERSLARKVREVLLARRIEAELGKNEILFLYVNHIAFGHGRYGVEEAARFYFGKHVGELTLGECTLLAGIPKSPVHYSPRNHLDAALRRRRWILGQMVANQFVTPAEAERAAAEPVHLASTPEDEGTAAPEVVELARRALAQIVGEDALRRGGYVVHTTVDPQLQRAAREALVRGLQQLDARHGYLGPLARPGERRPAGSGNVLRAEPPPPDGRLLPGRIYTALVVAAEDPTPESPRAGALVVRVGEATGRIPWDTATRYANGLLPSQWAPVGATVRVSPDQPITPDAPGTLRLELGPQGALVAIDPNTRELLAMVGSYEALPGLLNRALRATRQPGSAFKPFLYSFALASRRFTAASTIDPNPACFGTGRGRWCPAEAHAREGLVEPPMRLREALAQSRNMVAARLMEALGPDAVATHARALGLRLESSRSFDLTLALGSATVTPVEIVNAYATWASGGRAEEWFAIRRIVSSDGRSLPLPPRPPARQVITPAEAYLVTSLLTSVVQQGTARAARALNRPVAGKTGTTDRARDAWFVGYTTDLVAGVWVGFDDRQPLGPGEEGARAALPIWLQFMREYVRVRRPPAIEFPRPAGVVTARIDPRTGLLALPPSQPLVDPAKLASSLEEVFLEGTEPQEMALPDGSLPDGALPDAVPLDLGLLPPSAMEAPQGETPLVLPVEELPPADPRDPLAPPAMLLPPDAIPPGDPSPPTTP